MRSWIIFIGVVFTALPCAAGDRYIAAVVTGGTSNDVCDWHCTGFSTPTAGVLIGRADVLGGALFLTEASIRFGLAPVETMDFHGSFINEEFRQELTEIYGFQTAAGIGYHFDEVDVFAKAGVGLSQFKDESSYSSDWAARRTSVNYETVPVLSLSAGAQRYFGDVFARLEVEYRRFTLYDDASPTIHQLNAITMIGVRF